MKKNSVDKFSKAIRREQRSSSFCEGKCGTGLENVQRTGVESEWVNVKVYGMVDMVE